MNNLSTPARAVIFKAPQQVVVGDVQLGALGPTDVAVRTAYSWISPGTELSFLRGERASGDVPADGDRPAAFPIVPGYQKVGTIIALGEEVHGLTLGQWVFVTVGRVEGMYDPYGGHVAVSVSPHHQIWPIPQDAPPMQYSGLVLAQVGWNCGIRPKVVSDGIAWVVGDGLVGLWAAQTLQSRGMRVRLIGRHAHRLAKLKPGKHDQIDHLQSGRRVVDLGGEDPASVIDTIGDIDMLHAMTGRIRHGGDIVCAGFYPAADELHIRAIRARELTVHTPAGWASDRLRQTRDAIQAGVLDTESMITHQFPVEQAAEAYRVAADRSSQALGVILKW